MSTVQVVIEIQSGVVDDVAVYANEIDAANAVIELLDGSTEDQGKARVNYASTLYADQPDDEDFEVRWFESEIKS